MLVYRIIAKKAFGNLILLLCKTWATFCRCFAHQHGRLITWAKTKNRLYLSVVCFFDLAREGWQKRVIDGERERGKRNSRFPPLSLHFSHDWNTSSLTETKDPTPNNMKGLKRRLKQAWKNIQLSTLWDRFRSIPRRLQDVLTNKGWNGEYLVSVYKGIIW